MLFRSSGQSLVIHAPAKLNLFLEILGKRPDGYHELETLMVTIGLHDTILIRHEPTHAVRLCCQPANRRLHGAGVPTDASNLVVRAAELLRRTAGIDQGVDLVLRKRIPATAGLGGGSSNAAAALLGLNRFWNLQFTTDQLARLSAELGSDVPFFVHQHRAAICRGRGEAVQPIPMRHNLHFLIVYPARGLSTPDVYRRWRPIESPRSVRGMAAAVESGASRQIAEGLHNALQSPAAELNSDIRRLHDRFSRLPVLGHQLSGSGSAYFAVCRHRRQATSLAARLRAERFGCVVVASCRP